MALNLKALWWYAAGIALAAWCGTVAATSAPAQDHERIRERVNLFLLQQLSPAQRKDAKIDIGRLDPRLRLRQCPAPLQAFAVGGRPTVGATSVGVRCPGDRPWTLYVTARVVVFDNVLVAAHALDRGQPIRAGDLQATRKDLSQLPYGYLTDAQTAVGKVLKRSYLPGQVVQPNQLAAPLLVKRGQQVTLHAEAGGIEIHMGGKAMSDGAVGERIRVRNVSSNRIVEGEVIAKGVVRVRI